MSGIINHLLFIPISGCHTLVCPGAHNISKTPLLLLNFHVTYPKALLIIIMLALHNVPGGHVSPTRRARGILAIFCSIFKVRWVLLRFLTVCHGVRDGPCVEGTRLLHPGSEAQKRTAVWPTIYHGRQYVPSTRVTFQWDPSRISRCDQGSETFSRSVKAFYYFLTCRR